MWDVVIVGAGPGGAYLGYELSRRGIKTLLLDKERFPRDKPCAGGLTPKVLKILPFDISDVIERKVMGARISLSLSQSFSRFAKNPLIYTVRRDRFDKFILDRACEAGAQLVEGFEAKGVCVEREYAEVFGDRESFRGRVVVGADGANSVISKSFSLDKRFKKFMALKADIYLPESLMEEWNFAHIDIGILGAGYAWIFPKRDHLSVGVGGPLKYVKFFKNYFERFINFSKLSKFPIKNIKSHPLSSRLKKTPLTFGRVLVLGDAGGFVNPYSGEGIYYALYGAKKAATVIERFLSGEGKLGDFEFEIEDMLREFKGANFLLRLLFLFPKTFFRLIKEFEVYWNVTYELLSSERSYEDVMKIIKRRPKFLFKILKESLFGGGYAEDRDSSG